MTSGLRAKSALAAGNAGSITIEGGYITTGMLQAAGGMNTGTGGGGQGGDVLILTGTIDVGIDKWATGTVSVRGYIDARGGAASRLGGNGGIGGDVFIDAATISISSTVAGASVITSGGKGSTPAGTGAGGTITLNTYAVQPLTTSLDLTSKTANIPVLPGGLFTVATGSIVNGVRGKLVSNTNIVDRIAANGNGNIFEADPVNLNDVIKVTVTGTNVNINDVSTQPQIFANGKRGVVTPAQSIALLQVSRTQNTGDQTIELDPITGAAIGGSIDLNQVDINGVTFRSFNLPAGVEMNVSGSSPALNLPSSMKIAGELNFTDATMAYLNINGSRLNLPSTGSITSAGDLYMSGVASMWTNNGIISAGDLILGRPTGAAFTFFTGLGGQTNVDNFVLGPTSAVGMNVTIRSQGAASTNVPVLFSNSILTPGLYSPNAMMNALYVTTPRAVTLAFNQVNGAGAPIDGIVGGALNQNVRAITILGRSNNSITLSDGAAFAAGGNIRVLTTNKLTVGDGVTIDAGAFNGYSSGLIARNQIAKLGSITLSSTGSGGIEIGDGVQMKSIGANLQILAATSRGVPSGNIVFGSGGTFKAVGGNISIRGLGTISGETGNVFDAVGRSARSATGGVEFVSGSMVSRIASAFARPADTEPSDPNILGTGTVINSNRGVVLPTTQPGGSINLTVGGSAATLTLDRGAINFGANLPGNSIQFQGITINTLSTRPVSVPEAAPAVEEFVVDTADDDDAELMVLAP